MRIARFKGGYTGLVVGTPADAVLDVWASLGGIAPAGRATLEQVLPDEGRGSWEVLIARWDEVRPLFDELLQAWRDHSPAVKTLKIAPGLLEAPLPSRERRIFALGANTLGHILAASAQLGTNDVTPEKIYAPKNAGAAPVGFNVLPDSVIGTETPIMPPAFVQKLDCEAECAVVVGRPAAAGGASTIWGVAVWNDLGMRDGHLGLVASTPSFGYSMNLWKNFDSANVLGPWVVVDEDLDLRQLRCQGFVNGQPRQDWNTSEMIYSFEETMAIIERHMPLKPGDMIASGTGAGCALEFPIDSDRWLRPGDVVEIRVEGVGSITNTVGDWSSSRPARV